MQSLLVGVALALALGLRRRGRVPQRLPAGVVAALGWGGLAAMVVAYVAVPPLAGWMFGSGGILLSSLATAALVTACADPRPSLLTTALGQRPLAYLGKLSYGLYLWHWPIHLWLRDAMPGAPTWLHLAVGMVLTIAVAAASYELIERRVMRGGVRALVPGGRTRARIAVVATLVVLLAGAVAVGQVPSTTQQAAAATRGPVPMLVDGTPAYRPGASSIRVGVLGDSVPLKLLQGKPATYTDLATVSLAEPGCDLTDVPLGWSDRDRTTPTPTCLALKRDVAQRSRAASLDVLVLMTGTLVPLPHVMNGKPVGLDDPTYQRLVLSRLDQLHRDAIAGGVKQVQVATVPCRDRDISYLPETYRAYLERHPAYADAAADPVALNRLLTTWARSHGVAVLDLYAATGCDQGYAPTRHGISLFDDGIHFSPEATPMIWTWLAPAIRSAYKQRVGAGS